jgi:hypothetical protein
LRDGPWKPIGASGRSSVPIYSSLTEREKHKSEKNLSKSL